MGKAALIALALAGCNEVYGLDATHLADARPPPRCTDNAPDFKGKPVLVYPSATVRSYSISLDHALAVANDPGAIYEGPGDSPMLHGAMLMPPPAPSVLTPRLAPEGDELFVSYNGATIERYSRSADVWKHEAVALSVKNLGFGAPTPRALGPRHMLVIESSQLAHEYVETALDQWQPVGDYRPPDLGTSNLSSVALTPDGLHVIAGAFGTLGYASRARLEDRFSNPVGFNPFFGAPELTDPSLVPECARLYFISSRSTAPGVYYVDSD